MVVRLVLVHAGRVYRSVKLLAGAGGIAVFLAGSTFIVEPLLLKAPLSQDSHLRASGPASFLDKLTGKPRAGTFVQDSRVRTHVLNGRRAGTSTVSSYDQSTVSSFVDATSGGRQQIATSTLTHAFDRTSGAGRPGMQGDTVGTTAHLLKLPFDTQKHDYEIWDETAKKAVPLRYTGEKMLDGLTTYVFSRTVPPTDLGELPVFKAVPGSFVGRPTIPSIPAHEWYENTSSTLYVEPVTGSLVGGESSPHLWAQTTSAPVGLKVDLLTVDGAEPVAADAARLAHDAKGARSKVLQLRRLPYELGGLGLLLLAAAGVLAVRQRPDAPTAPDVTALLPAPRVATSDVGIAQ
jgi:hypothetical protein